MALQDRDNLGSLAVAVRDTHRVDVPYRRIPIGIKVNMHLASAAANAIQLLHFLTFNHCDPSEKRERDGRALDRAGRRDRHPATPPTVADAISGSGPDGS